MEKKNDKVRFAIYGTGHMAYQHAMAMKKSRNCELVAVVSNNSKRAEDLSKRLKVEGFKDFDTLIKSVDFEVMDVVTYNHLHADIGIKAATAGKHVIVEKPIDISLAKAERLIEACKKNGVALSVISQKRFDGGVKMVKNMIDSGELGRVFLIRASVRWRRTQGYYDDSGGWRKKTEYAGGGVFMYQAIHFVDILLWFLGPVESVFGETSTATHSIGVEDTGAAIIRFKNGAIGCIDATTSVRCNIPDRLEIYGEMGSIVLERNHFTVWAFNENPVVSMIRSKLKAPIPMRLGTIGDQIEDFAKAIKSGSSLAVTGKDGSDALKVVLGFYDSVRTGRPVKIVN